MRLGRQYVFKTPFACDAAQLRIDRQYAPADLGRKRALAFEKNRDLQTGNILNELKTRYRHATDVLYFDELIGRYNGQI